MKNEFVTAIAQLSAEKNLNADTVFEAVEAAMASAFKKDELQYAEIEVKIDRDSGDIHAWRLFNVIDDDEIEDDEIEVSPERAAEMGHAGAAIGDVVREVLEENPNAGRIAAQTAKQVVLQRLREAERESVFEDFTGKEGELVSGTVLRVEGGRRQVILDLGRTEAVLPAAEQVRPEHYRVGQRLRVYVKEVYKASKGPQVVVSRANPALIKRLFELEVPEISRGAVEVMGIAREPGYRAKVAVISRQHGIDPIGATVGVRGSRIQNLVNELGGERIDLIRWDPNEAAFVANALSPAEVVSIKLDEDTHTAFVAVPDKQLSLAIGKEGQNARLAAKLTGWRIDIRAESALIKAGEDMYQPPEPNTEAIPLRDQPGLAAATTLELPDEVAPSISAYGRPGLPGERRTVVAPTPAPAAEPVPHEVRLTPELEVLADLVEEDEPAALATPEPAAPPARPREDRGTAGGLRFAEEIRDLRPEDDEEDSAGRDRRARRRRTGGGPGVRREPAAPRAPVRATRRFEMDIDEDEIEAALKGEDFLGEDEDEENEGDDA